MTNLSTIFKTTQTCFCNGGRHIETTIHFLLHYSNYSNNFFWRKLVVLNILYWTKMMHLWLKHSYLHWISLNDFNGKENALISESKIDCIIIKKRFIVPILWFHVSKSSLFLKTLIDCVLLNVHHQGYVVSNLFLLIFFIFVCIIFIEKNMELYS